MGATLGWVMGIVWASCGVLLAAGLFGFFWWRRRDSQRVHSVMPAVLREQPGVCHGVPRTVLGEMRYTLALHRHPHSVCSSEVGVGVVVQEMRNDGVFVDVGASAPESHKSSPDMSVSCPLHILKAGNNNNGCLYTDSGDYTHNNTNNSSSITTDGNAITINNNNNNNNTACTRGIIPRPPVCVPSSSALPSRSPSVHVVPSSFPENPLLVQFTPNNSVNNINLSATLLNSNVAVSGAGLLMPSRDSKKGTSSSGVNTTANSSTSILTNSHHHNNMTNNNSAVYYHSFIWQPEASQLGSVDSILVSK